MYLFTLFIEFPFFFQIIYGVEAGQRGPHPTNERQATTVGLSGRDAWEVVWEEEEEKEEGGGGPPACLLLLWKWRRMKKNAMALAIRRSTRKTMMPMKPCELEEEGVPPSLPPAEMAGPTADVVLTTSSFSSRRSIGAVSLVRDMFIYIYIEIDGVYTR